MAFSARYQRPDKHRDLFWPVTGGALLWRLTRLQTEISTMLLRDSSPSMASSPQRTLPCYWSTNEALVSLPVTVCGTEPSPGSGASKHLYQNGKPQIFALSGNRTHCDVLLVMCNGNLRVLPTMLLLDLLNHIPCRKFGRQSRTSQVLLPARAPELLMPLPRPCLMSLPALPHFEVPRVYLKSGDGVFRHINDD